MGFMWGSFADGFTRGFQNGWDLGDKITSAMDKAEFRSNVDKADKKADEATKQLDTEREGAPKAKERNATRKQAVERGSGSLMEVSPDRDAIDSTLPRSSAIDVGTGTTYRTDLDTNGNPMALSDPVAKPYEDHFRKYGAGNIPLDERPELVNKDGSVSTVRTMGVNIDGRETNLPTISDDGRAMSNEEAVREYMRTGRHLGRYDTPQEAEGAAVRLHNDQDQMVRARQEDRGSLTLGRDSDQFRQALPAGTPGTSPQRDAALEQEHVLTEQEYQQRRQEILETQKRETLQAHLNYWKGRDPEKYMEVKKGLYDLDTDTSIRDTIMKARNGDSAAMGVMVKTLQQVGFFPEGSQFSEGANGGVRVTDASGKVLWDGAITPGLVEQATPYFAVAAKHLANGNYEGVIKLADDRRKARNEDTKLGMEKEKLNNDKIRTNIAVGEYDLKRAIAAGKAAAPASTGGQLSYKPDDRGSMVGYNAQGRPVSRILTNTQTHEQIEIPYTWTENDVNAVAKSLPSGVQLNFAHGVPVVQKDGMAMTLEEFKAGSQEWHPVAQAEAPASSAVNLPGIPNVTGANMHGYKSSAVTVGGSASKSGSSGSGQHKATTTKKTDGKKEAAKKEEKKSEAKKEEKPKQKRLSEAELKARLQDENMTSHTKGFANLAGTTWDMWRDKVAPGRRDAWPDKK